MNKHATSVSALACLFVLACAPVARASWEFNGGNWFASTEGAYPTLTNEQSIVVWAKGADVGGGQWQGTYFGYLAGHAGLGDDPGVALFLKRGGQGKGPLCLAASALFADKTWIGVQATNGVNGVSLTNGWHSYAAVYRAGSFMRLYVDGQRVAECTDAAHLRPLVSRCNFMLGTNNRAQFGCRGLMTCASFWGRALADDEVRCYAHAAPTGKEAGLVGYWPFASDFKDAVANGALPHHFRNNGLNRKDDAPVLGAPYEWEEKQGLISVSRVTETSCRLNAAADRAVLAGNGYTRAYALAAVEGLKRPAVDVAGLRPGTAYTVSFEKNGKKVATEAFVTVAESASGDAGASSEAGLFQFRNDKAFGRTLSPYALLYDSDRAWKTVDGAEVTWGENCLYAYKGFMRLPKGTVRFRAQMDDAVTVFVNGKKVLDGGCSDNRGDIVLDEGGWCPVELRAYNGGGPAGPRGIPFQYSAGDGGVWIRAENDAGGSLFRTAIPCRALTTYRVACKDGVFSAAFGLLPAEDGEPLELRAYQGATWGGDDEKAWESCETLRTGISSNEVRVADFSFKLHSGVRFVRFMLVSPAGGSRWSETYAVDWTGDAFGPVFDPRPSYTPTRHTVSVEPVLLTAGSAESAVTVTAFCSRAGEPERKKTFTAVKGANACLFEGLFADKEYAVRLEAKNAAGHASDPIAYTFRTLPLPPAEQLQNNGMPAKSMLRTVVAESIARTASGYKASLAFGPAGDGAAVPAAPMKKKAAADDIFGDLEDEEEDEASGLKFFAVWGLTADTRTLEDWLGSRDGGVVPSEKSSAEIAFPALSSGTRYVRFALTDGKTLSWSPVYDLHEVK